MGPQLEALASTSSELKLRIVDIGSWESEVAKQHGIHRLPTIWLYEDGKLVTKDRDTILRRLQDVK